MSRLPIPLASFLGTMEQDDTPLSFPMIEAQREKLDELLRASKLNRRFERGDEVHMVRGQGPITAEAIAGVAFIFWRYLSGSPEDDERLVKASVPEFGTLPDIDCLLAYYDGQGVKFQIYCSYMLQPGPRPKED